MSELRRNRGPDGGDQPEKIAKVDNPQRRPSLEIRTSDQIEGREIDRREVTPAQRDFIRAERQAAASGVPRKPLTTYSMDWESGDHVDGWYDPPPRDDDHDDHDDQADSSDKHEPDAPPSVRDELPASDLDAYKPELPETADPADRFSDITVRRRRGDRIASELAEKADDIVEHVGDVFKAFEELAGPRPPGHAQTQCRPSPPWAQPVASGATHSGVDIVMAIAAGGLAATEAGRRMRDRVHDWRERRAGNG